MMAVGFNKRDRSDSLDRAVFDQQNSGSNLGQSPSRLHELVWESENFLPGSRERVASLEQMHTMLVERSKKMRDGPGPNSYKQNDGDILEDFYMGNDASGNLDDHGDHGLDHGLNYDMQDRFGDAGHYGSLGKGGGMHSGGFFAMDDVDSTAQALSNSFKESVSFAVKDELPAGMPSFQSSMPPPLPPGRAVAKPKKGALAAPFDEEGPAAGHAPSKVQAKPTAAGMMGVGGAAATVPTTVSAVSLTTPMAATLLDENTERLSHKEVEQRRREKAKLYFDELRALLPCGADSKFDKNTILQNTIAMIKQLQAELDFFREAKLGGKRPLATQPGCGDYRTSFDVTRQPLCFCGLDGCVWESNAAFCNLMGYTKQEITGLSLLNSTAPCDSDASSQHWQRLISSGMCNCAFYCHVIRKDSQQLLVNMDLNLIHKKNQPYCFMVATNPTA